MPPNWWVSGEMGAEPLPPRPNRLSTVVLEDPNPPFPSSEAAKLFLELLLCRAVALGSCSPEILLFREDVLLRRPLLSSEVFPSSPRFEGDDSHEMFANELNAPSPPVDAPPSDTPNE